VNGQMYRVMFGQFNMFSEIGNKCVCVWTPIHSVIIVVTFLIDKFIGRIEIAVADCIKIPTVVRGIDHRYLLFKQWNYKELRWKYKTNNHRKPTSRAGRTRSVGGTKSRGMLWDPTLWHLGSANYFLNLSRKILMWCILLLISIVIGNTFS